MGDDGGVQQSRGQAHECWSGRCFQRHSSPPVLLQRLPLVFLMLHHASLPCQASITSKLFSAVYYTKVILEPGTRIPKTKVFLCMEVEKGCMLRVSALQFYKEVKFNLLPLLLFCPIYSLFYFLFCAFFCSPDRILVMRNTTRQTITILQRKPPSVEVRNKLFSFWANR